MQPGKGQLFVALSALRILNVHMYQLASSSTPIADFKLCPPARGGKVKAVAAAVALPERMRQLGERLMAIVEGRGDAAWFAKEQPAQFDAVQQEATAVLASGLSVFYPDPMLQVAKVQRAPTVIEQSASERGSERGSERKTE